VVSLQSTASQQSTRYGPGRTLGLPGGPSVLVTSVPDGDGLLACGSEALVAQRPPACSQPARGSGTIQPGQWFTDPASGLEVVCTRAGHGVLTFDGRPLLMGRPRPASARRQRAGDTA
jgi:hypothetical protein